MLHIIQIFATTFVCLLLLTLICLIIIAFVDTLRERAQTRKDAKIFKEIEEFRDDFS